MDNHDKFEREIHIALGGSGTIVFAKGRVANLDEHFNASISALKKLGCYAEHRPVCLEIELEAYFLSLFSCLESVTLGVCADLRKVSRHVLRIDDIKGETPFDRAMKYLKIYESIHKIDRDMLSTLETYRSVRNAIAHGAGVSSLVSDKRKKALKLPGLHERRDSEGSLQMELTKDFCAEFSRFAVRYIDELEKIVRAYGNRVQQKVTKVRS